MQAPSIMPRIRAQTFSFPEKNRPSKVWWGWSLAVFAKGASGQEVVLMTLESHTTKKPKLFHKEEAAKRDLHNMVEKIQGIIKSGYEAREIARKISLVMPGGAT